MRRELRTKVDLLAKYPAAVKDAIMTAESDEELLDVLGTVVATSRRVTEERRLAQAEVLPTAAEGRKSGEDWSVEVLRQARRTYNTPAIMKTMQDNGISFLDLMDANVMTVSWRWTDLKRYADQRGIKLLIQPSEVPTMGQPDGKHIGEIWGEGSPKWTAR